MILRRCERCECPVDPDERLCSDCVEELEEERRHKAELARMVRAKDFKQMEMEELLCLAEK